MSLAKSFALALQRAWPHRINLKTFLLSERHAADLQQVESTWSFNCDAGIDIFLVKRQGLSSGLQS